MTLILVRKKKWTKNRALRHTRTGTGFKETSKGDWSGSDDLAADLGISVIIDSFHLSGILPTWRERDLTHW